MDLQTGTPRSLLHVFIAARYVPAVPKASPQWSLSFTLLYIYFFFFTTVVRREKVDVRKRLEGRRGTGHFRVRDRLFLTFLAHVTTRPRNSRAFVVSGVHPTVTRECTRTDAAEHRQDLMLGHVRDNTSVWVWLGNVLRSGILFKHNFRACAVEIRSESVVATKEGSWKRMLNADSDRRCLIRAQ